ncbi:MAG: PQQ-binding-like beta-propeller repeat protein, partial [Ornithinimicrobium sp.]
MWATDSNGVPHFFSDDVDGWTRFGRGIDAIAYDTNGDQMVFRGQEYLTGGGRRLKIADTWPALPYSFRLGVDGAANVAGTLYLFKNGLYVSTDDPGSAAALKSLGNWPTDGAWSEGLIDAVGSQKSGSFPATLSPLVLMFLGGEYLIADIVAQTVVQAPRALDKDFGALAAELAAGFDGLVIDTTGGVRTVDAYQGMKHWVYRPQGHPQLPVPEAFEWQEDWSPWFTHAPCGQVGALWALSTEDGDLFRHDGADWELRDFTPPGRPASISVGSDGLLHVLTSENSVHRLEDSGSWTKLADASMALTQIAVGDVNSVFVRDEEGAVHRLRAGALVAVDTGAQATDMSVSADGALWHAHQDHPEVYRKVTDAAQKSEALSVGQSISGLRSITTTGFGSAYMLADKDGGTQVLSFKSAILMKTPGNYQTGFADQMTIGSGCLFVSMYTGGDTGTAHACIDAHTGLERWRVTLPGQIDPNAPKLPESVYDPVYHLIYLAMGSDIAALDVHTGTVVWRYATNHGALTARPTLAGNLLCFVTDAQAVIAFDTAAANAAVRKGDNVSPLWTYAAEPQPGSNFAQPLLVASGMVIASTWNVRPVGKGETVKTLVVTALRTGAGLTDTQRVVWIKDIAAAPGGYSQDDEFGRQAQPVFCPAVTIHTTGVSPIEDMEGDALVMGWDHSIHLVAVQDGRQLGEYEIPEDSTNSITSGVTIWPGQPQEFTGLNVRWTMPICVFGTSSGTLYAIAVGPLNQAPETRSKPVWNTPFQATTKSGIIRTTPFLRSLNEAPPIIHYGLTSDTSLYSYDPTTGEAATQGTGATAVTTLAPAGNGVLYAGGFAPNPSQVAQYFAIRLDDAVFLDFLVESHLMEDYDGNEKDTTHHTRYQTHVTMLDATKAPRPNQAVKIWSDESTKLQVDGVFHDVGPTTPVHFQTDGTGSFTLVSDAESTRTSPLRLHADFMDDHERVIIYPDREFHGRLTETQAEPDGGEEDLNDPQRVNLSTAKDFKGAHLCDPKTQQAEHTKTAVLETTTAVGLGALGTPLGQLKSQPEQGLGKYVAYATTPGVASLGTNTPAYLLTDIKKTTGFVLGQDDVTVLSAVEAAAAVDGLTGEEVDPGSLGAVEVGGFFKNLWHFIHSLGDKIKKIAVSIGKAVYAGIQFVVDGVEKVVRVAIRTISDIASLIGGFFVKLGKLIKQIVEALAILFHLKEIINTAKTLRGLFKTVDKEVAGLVTQGKKVIDKYFEDFETTIDKTFEKLIESLHDGMDSAVGGGGISGITGMGSTTHTAFTVGPKDKSHPPKSHATQCTWGAHKVRHQYKNSNQIPPSGLGADAPDPFTEFVTNFLNALENDPELKTAMNQAHAQLNSGFKAGSAKDFLESAVEDFLELLKVIIIGAVAVVKAFLDAIMDSLAESIQALGGLKIPILSPLWKAITGEDLPFLDIVTFVLAIPVTIIYRIVEKAWPPQYPEGDEVQLRDLETGTWDRIFGLAGGVAFIAGGLLTAINDTLFILQGIIDVPVSSASKILKGIVGASLLFAMVFKSVWAAAKNPTDDNVILAITAAAGALAAVGGGVPVKIDEDPRAFASIMSVVGLMIGIVSFWPTIALYADKKTDAVKFAASFTATLPALVNPLKLLNPDTLLPAIVPVVDIAGRGAAGGLTIAETIIKWDEPAPAPEEPTQPEEPTDPGDNYPPADPATGT